MSNLKNILSGFSREHVVACQAGTLIHREMESSLKRLIESARDAGFDLSIASGFRDYRSQLNIWNRKATGERMVLDSSGNPIDIKKLTPKSLVYAILRWSALPGASRHHWGTEIDVFDRNSMPKDYQVRLIPAEAAPDGVFGRFNQWLNEHIAEHGFFRPYSTDRGGVSPEWWHLSYAPVSKRYFDEFSLDLCDSVIQNVQMELKSVVLENLPDIYQRFVTNISRS